MKHFLAFFFGCILFISSSCSLSCVEGIGEVETIELDLDVFEGITQESAVPITVSFGLNQKVEVEGQRNLIDLLSNEVSGGCWNISFREHVCADDMNIHITLPVLNQMNLYGSGDINGTTPFRAEKFELKQRGSGNVTLDLNSDKLEVDMEGSGEVTLTGLTGDMKIDLEGSGSLEASDLKAMTAKVHSDGSGSVRIYVSEELKMDLNGSGNIIYKGNPADLEMSRSGSGEAKAE